MAVERALTALTNLTRALRVVKGSGVEPHLTGVVKGDRSLQETFLDKEALLQRYRGYLEPTIQLPGTPASEGREEVPPFTISQATARSIETAQDIVAPAEPLSPRDAALVSMAQFAYRMMPRQGESADEGMDYRNKTPFHPGRRGRTKETRARVGELVNGVVGGYMTNVELSALSEFNKHQHALDPRNAGKHTLAALVQVGLPMALRWAGPWGAAGSLLLGHFAAEGVKGIFGDQIITRDGTGYERAHKPYNIGSSVRELMSTIADFSKVAHIPGLENFDPRSIDFNDHNVAEFFTRALFVNHPAYFTLRQRTSAYELLTRDEIATRQAIEAPLDGAKITGADIVSADDASPDDTIDTGTDQ